MMCQNEDQKRQLMFSGKMTFYYARARRKNIQGWILAGPVQTIVGAAPALKIAQKHKLKQNYIAFRIVN